MRVANKKNLIIAAALIVVFAIVQALRSAGIIGNFYEITIAQVCINIILAASLNLITGFTGQFSLGHAGFMSIGAYVCALSTLKNPTAGGFVAGVCLGALAATAVGLCIGIPTLRLKGDYLAIATLGVSEIIRIAFLNMKSTNGAAGLMNIPRLVDWKWLFWLTVFSVVLLRNFILSKHGRACVSIREDEIAAASIGINTTFYKIAAFAVGAFFAGIAGSMYASYFYFLKPDLFGFLKSIDMLVIVVLGGLGSLTGSVVSAIFLTIATALMQGLGFLRMIVYALLLISIMLFRPKGIMGTRDATDFFPFQKREQGAK